MGFEESSLQQGVALAVEARVLFDPVLGVAPGHGEQFQVGRKARHAKRGEAGLSSAAEGRTTLEEVVRETVLEA